MPSCSARLVSLLAAILSCWGTIQASPTGSIRGTVTDPAGAAVSGARISAVNVSTGQSRATLADIRGEFELLQLSPGAWSLTAEAPRFKRTTLPQAIVQVDQITQADLALALGDVSETIEVNAASPMVDTARSTLSSVVGNSSIASLPLNGRQYLDLALLAPGVVPPAPGTQGNGFNTAGARSQSNVYLLDGISNQDTQTNQPLNLFRITDAVEEFAVQTAVPLPEFGRGMGAQVNVVTRSGTNSLHGSLFEYVRNTDFDAADFFTNKLGGQKAALHRNQFGATVGGPIARNRTFFFVSYEGFRQVAPAVTAALVPSEAQRATVTDPVSQHLLAYWPLPNATGALNYIANVGNSNSDDTGLVRVDQRIGSRDQLAARWTEYWGYSVVPGPTPLSGGNRGPFSQVSSSVSDVHTFSANFLNELRLGFSRDAEYRVVQDYGLDASAIFISANGTSLGAVNAAGNPRDSGLSMITVGGGFAVLGTNQNFPQGRASDTIEIVDNVTAVAPFGASRHTFRWGYHVRREDLSRYLDRAERGTINFQTFADFAKGMIMTSTFRTGSTQAYWRRYPWDAYWEDEFKARPNLTLNFGLRYEYPSAATELRQHAANFVPGYGPVIVGTNQLLAINPALVGPSSLAEGAAPFSLPASGVYADRNNFAPMLGFAYSPRPGGSGTVIRGGFRVAYDDLFNNVPSAMALAPPYNLQTTQTANVTQPAKFPWSLAFNQNVPLISNLGKQGPGTPVAGIVSFQGIDPHLRSTYAYLYHFGIERQISTSLSLGADYEGSSGHRLGVYVDQNQPAVIVRDATKRGPVAPNEQVFPYPQWGQSQAAKSIGNSNYNGLVTALKYRGRRGAFAQASYTLGKSLDYNSSYFGSGNQPGEPGAPVDSRNLRLEHARSAFDVRQRFVASFTAPIPVASRHPVFGGWQLAGILILQSGTPFTAVTGGPDTSGFNQSTAGTNPDGGNRPNLARPGAVPQDNGNPDAAFDGSWFTPNLAGQDGTAGRNILTAPGLENFDLAASKRFALGGERTSVQFRADFFNLFNHTNFAAPIANMNDANFGKITQTLGSAVATSVGTSGGATGGPRVIQLSLRLRF